MVVSMSLGFMHLTFVRQNAKCLTNAKFMKPRDTYTIM